MSNDAARPRIVDGPQRTVGVTLDLRSLVAFSAVAQHKNFTRAAEELELAQSTISSQIRQLEAYLGVELFERTSRSVRLSSAGEALLVRSKRIFAEIAAAESELQSHTGVLRGWLRLGTMRALGPISVAGLLGGYTQRHPAVEIAMREHSSQRMLDMLARRELDVAFVQLPSTPLPRGVDSATLWTEGFALLVSPNHRLAGAGAVSLTQLKHDNFVAYGPGTGIDRSLRSACEQLGFQPKIKIESGLLGTVAALAAQGLGAAMLPRSFAESVPDGVALTITDSIPPRRVALAWGELDKPVVAAFVNLTLRRYPPDTGSDPAAE